MDVQKNKGGRPPLPVSERKTVFMAFRLTEDESRRFCEYCKSRNVKYTDFLKKAVYSVIK